jgi:hypothetical protein
LLGLAWVSSTTGLDAAAGLPGIHGMLALGIALLTTAALAGSAVIFHFLWRQAIAYTRTDTQIYPGTNAAVERVSVPRKASPQAPAHYGSDARVAHGRRRNARPAVR